MPSGSVSGDREFGSAGFLSVEKATNGFDGLKLIIEVGLEVEFHGSRSEATDRFEAVLVEDGRQVGLGHVIGERAVAKDHDTLASWGLLFVPRDYAKSQGLGLPLRDGAGEADEENATADAVDGLVGNGALNDRHAEVEAELEEQLEEDILLRAVGLEVNNRGFEGVGGELLLSPQSVEIIKFGDPGRGR